MSFQLVRASETEIAIWHVDQGHIFAFQVCPETDTLKQTMAREAPGATQPASASADAALLFATDEARSRKLIGVPTKTGRQAFCRTSTSA